MKKERGHKWNSCRRDVCAFASLFLSVHLAPLYRHTHSNYFVIYIPRFALTRSRTPLFTHLRIGFFFSCIDILRLVCEWGRGISNGYMLDRSLHDASPDTHVNTHNTPPVRQATHTHAKPTHLDVERLEEHAEGAEHGQAGVLDLSEGVVGADAVVSEAQGVEAQVAGRELVVGVLLLLLNVGVVAFS